MIKKYFSKVKKVKDFFPTHEENQQYQDLHPTKARRTNSVDRIATGDD